MWWLSEHNLHFHKVQMFQECKWTIFPYLIALVTTSSHVNRYVINVIYITAEVPHPWKGEISHFNGMKAFDKMISQPSVPPADYISCHEDNKQFL